MGFIYPRINSLSLILVDMFMFIELATYYCTGIGLNKFEF